METKGEYIPGTCNIGPSEIKARRNSAIVFSTIAIALIILLPCIHAGKLWRVTLFIPAASAGISFQQLYFRFCVNFGLRGVFNFGEIGKTFSVEQKEYFKIDRMKARRMIITGIIFGIIVSVIFYLLPV